eukprot:6466663-Amphidinium_carterae.1
MTRFGTISSSDFDIREGATDPADLVPRAAGPGSGLAVNVLLPKEEVLLSKHGSGLALTILKRQY